MRTCTDLCAFWLRRKQWPSASVRHESLHLSACSSEPPALTISIVAMRFESQVATSALGRISPNRQSRSAHPQRRLHRRMLPSSAFVPPLLGNAAQAQLSSTALLLRPRCRMAGARLLMGNNDVSKASVTSAAAVHATEHVVEIAVDLSKHRAHWWVPPPLPPARRPHACVDSS